MAYGDDSDRIRKHAWSRYIEPQIRKGLKRFSIPIKPIMKDLEADGFPANHPRQFCKALQKRAFLHEKGLVLNRIDGPPSGTSTTVVLHFTLLNDSAPATPSTETETSEQWAERVTGSMQGLLREEIASLGGAEAFMKWVRSEDDGGA